MSYHIFPMTGGPLANPPRLGHLPALLSRKRFAWDIRRAIRDPWKLDHLSLRLLNVMAWFSRFVDFTRFDCEASRLNHEPMGMQSPSMLAESLNISNRVLGPDIYSLMSAITIALSIRLHKSEYAHVEHLNTIRQRIRTFFVSWDWLATPKCALVNWKAIFPGMPSPAMIE